MHAKFTGHLAEESVHWEQNIVSNVKGKINNYTEIMTELLMCLYAKSRNIQQSSPLRLRSTLRQSSPF